MTSAQQADYEWLMGADAARWLTELADDQRPVERLIQVLRRDLNAMRTHLVVEQLCLRRRARIKFARASDMFFTAKGLEQATDERLASYKADRFAALDWAVDLCSGIGGDALAMARRRPTVAVERDGVVAALLAANARILGLDDLQAVVEDAERLVGEESWLAGRSLERAWHIDPDRRAAGQRTIRLDNYEPGPDTVSQWRQWSRAGAVKLAPATEVPSEWAQCGECEWIETRGECRQQVVWFGSLARFVGRRTATIVDRDHTPTTICEDPNVEAPQVERPLRYVADPRPAVRAARLVHTLAARNQAVHLGPPGGYLTLDVPRADAAWQLFEVRDALPLDRRRLRAALQQRQWGRITWKCSGAAVDLTRLGDELPPLDGAEPGVVLATRFGGQTWAILATPALPDVDSGRSSTD